jgi:hypothetical protein
LPWKSKKSKLEDTIKVVIKQVEHEVSGLRRIVQSLLLLCLGVGGELTGWAPLQIVFTGLTEAAS